jgi:hypothetical protein
MNLIKNIQKKLCTLHVLISLHSRMDKNNGKNREIGVFSCKEFL